MDKDSLQGSFTIEPISRDGNCLFSSISYFVYNSTEHHARVRTEIVQYVIRNWTRLGPFSARPDGSPYANPSEYKTEMSTSGTFGSAMEIQAAAELYLFYFEVHGNGNLHRWGEDLGIGRVGRLRFSGPHYSGHFDVLIQSSFVTEAVQGKSKCTETVLKAALNQKKQRKRFSDKIRKRQLNKANKTYVFKNKEVHRIAVKKYVETNPEIHRRAVKKYVETNPEIHRNAVQKYTKKNPHLNREAGQRYKKKMKLLQWKSKLLSGFDYHIDLNYAEDTSIQIGKMDVVCSWCKAKKFKGETPGMCCMSGRIQLPQLQKPPEPICSLINKQDRRAEHFLKMTRQYNGCFQMTSFGAKEIREEGYMPTFKVQGQVYHRIGSLVPPSEREPAYLQIYFVGDEEEQTRIRSKNFPGLKPDLVTEIQRALHSNNIYIRDFKAAIERVPNGEDFRVVINADKRPSNEHRGRFNAPSANEVAVVIVGQAFEPRDIIIESKDEKLIRIHETHHSYDALQYPLMFCYGEDGYSINIPQYDPKNQGHAKKTVSAVHFYSYRLMERDGEQNHILHFRGLLNQYLVDMYAKIESERLSFIRRNQSKLRVENYIHLQDAINSGDAQASDLGKMVILPSSFTGGPRYMHERTQDAMTYVRHYGKPDLFITFTCNPHFTEIKEHLYEGQQPQDRHDLIARVFRLKVKEMMSLLTRECIFGKCRCYMYSVEWQKRGLPHIHILLWLEEHITPNRIDDVIRAEIPDPKVDPELYEIVKSNMIHGPCGHLNRRSPCMTNGTCSKRYPKIFTKETQCADDGYPQYRRRAPEDGGFTVHIKGIQLDNRWVVPYNPVLSRTFKAHINAEVCNSVKSIKYITKYIHKGSDQAAFALEDTYDEVKKYECGRYISSSEASWRIFCFPLHERFPPVMHLSVHLENGQRVYFTQENVLERLTNPPKTTLMAFFELCKTDSFARQLLYCEVPVYYIFINNKFQRRRKGAEVPGHSGVKKNHTIGRVYTVHPNNAECYYLRLLLHEVRGPTSFLDLKTVSGYVCPTFKEACNKLGLLQDDQHWNHTLDDAAICNSPNKLRELFSIMLVFCQLSDPQSLWEQHKDNLSEDIKRQMGEDCDPDLVYNRCLLLLEETVIDMGGLPIKQYGLPEPFRSDAEDSNREYLHEVSYDLADLGKKVTEHESLLNDDQRKVYEEVLKSITSEDGNIIFLDAPGGTGKTFLINLLLAKVRTSKKIALAVASSGIAATLLMGGKTAHSAFKLPLDLNHCEDPICNISKQSNKAQVLQHCKFIVWDEATMSHKGAVEALDKTLQDIRSRKTVMGGITVLLSGDFRQTLPVVPRGTRADEVKACLKSSYLWPKVKILSLKKNMRVYLGGHEDSQRFSNLLLKIGNGELNQQQQKIELSNNLCNVVKTIGALTEKIYPDVANNLLNKPLSWLRERAILAPKNEKVNDINNVLLNKLPGDHMIYKSVDTVPNMEDAVHYPVEFLNSLNPPSLPAHTLQLKVGVPIMLLRNLKPPKLCNGTRLRIRVLHKNVIEAFIITGCGEGESVLIPRIPLISSDYPFEFKRLQFPVKVCFAMTINKSQGQTLKEAGIDLREECFSHGQLYVACSRVSTAKNLTILKNEQQAVNVVYKEVL